MREMKVALLNAGLLQPVSGAAGSPPLYESRSARLNEALQKYLESEQPDIFLLTEIWHRKDFDAISRLAEQYGYLMLEEQFREKPLSGEEPTRTGLVGLVSRSQFEAVDVECIPLNREGDALRAEIEASFGVTCRVTLHALLRSAHGFSTSLYLQHLTPQIHDPSGAIRESQTIRLSKIIGDRWVREPADMLVVAGDFNFSLEHGTSDGVYEVAAEKDLYHGFIEHTSACGGPVLTDAWLAANEGDPGWTIDHRRNDLSRTGTFCDEPDRRVDMIFVGCRTSETRVSTCRCRLIFDKPLSLAGYRSSMLSDHFGVEANFLIDSGTLDVSDRETARVTSGERAALVTGSSKQRENAAGSLASLGLKMRSEVRPTGKRTREPSEPVPFLMSILKDAMPRFDLREPVGVMLIGSIAEGFGNAYSDIDFLVVSAQEEPLPLMRHMTTYGERRCEFFFRTAKQLAETAATVKQYSVDAEYDIAASEEFDLYHRVCCGVPLLNAHLVERACAPFDKRILTRLVSDIEESAMVEQMSRAWMFQEMGLGIKAAFAARRAVFAAAAAYSANRGETYRSRKFIFNLLENANAPEGAIKCLRKLSTFSGVSSKDYPAECLELIRTLGWPAVPESLPEFELNSEGDVSCWEIGAGCAVLLRDDQELFLLSGRGARYWKELTLDQTWNLERVRGNEQLFKFVCVAHAAGIVRIRWRASGRVWSNPRCLRNVPEVPFLIGALGESSDRSLEDSCDVAKYPQPAREVVGAVMNFLTFANYVENDKEDAVGAAGKGDWDLLADSLRRQVLHACMARLSVHGVYPIDVQKDEAYDSILQLEKFHETREFVDRAMQLLSLSVSNHAEAISVYQSVGDLTEDLMGPFLSDDQRQTYTSAAAWYRTLKVGTEWAMLADRLGVALPLDELGTLVSVAQGEQKFLMKQHSIAEQLSWRRKIDFVRELDKHLGTTAKN
jgi:hypothetical protein